MRTVYAIDRQNIVDLATQYYGSAAGVIDLCKDNGWELDHNVNAGDPVLIQDSYPDSANADVADYIAGNNIVVVSMSEASDGDALGTNDGSIIITNDGNYIGA